MIKIKKACKSFGDFKAVDQISLHVKPGTIHGLIGENGAGKTTLIQCLAGVYKLDEGEITIDGESVWDNEKLKEQIGYVADRNQFFTGYRVNELVSFFEGMYPTFKKEDFYKYNEIFKLKLKNKVSQLSKGMQMRLSFMLHMAIHPKVLILDEPTSGLDAIAKKELLDLLIEAVETEGLTVLISSHHLAELERICDEVTMIHKGTVTFKSSVDALKDRIKKLQVVFEQEAPEGLENWAEFLEVARIGSVYYLITRRYSKALEDKLRLSGARIVEPIGLTLEEIFIYANAKEMEEVAYE